MPPSASKRTARTAPEKHPFRPWRSTRAAAFLSSAVALGAVACGGGASPSSTSPGTGAPDEPTTVKSVQLEGAYTPDDASAGAFRALVFFGTDGYFAYANACAAGCRTQGTYTYDGAGHLALTDALTGETERVDFAPQSTGGELTSQTRPLDLVTAPDAGTALVSPLTALVNGVLMSLDVTDNQAGTLCDPEPTALDPKDPTQAVLDCAVQGAGPGTYDATGVCSCGAKTPDESQLRLAIESSFTGASDLSGNAPLDPGSLGQTARAFYDWNAQAGFFGQTHDPSATTYTVPGTGTTVVVIAATESEGGGPYWQFVTMDGVFVVSGDVSGGSLRWN